LNSTSVADGSFISRLKLFMALSRTPHGLLDMATPALGALLYLGGMPSGQVIALGLLTAFAGYTAVYALNDVVDYRSDMEKFRECGLPCSNTDLDAVYARHPLAQGLLSLREGILWTVAWAAVALIGAYALNPVCALIFLLGCLAEAVYCLMLRVSYLRTLVSGCVKTVGGVAAVFAVASHPSFMFVLFLFLWLFFWEIGGQNVPNDWCDADEDRALQAETIPVRFGTRDAATIILVSLVLAVLLSLVLFFVTPARLNPAFYFSGSLLAGTFLLLVPAYRLYASKDPALASTLFNRASTYPPVMLFIVLLGSYL